MAKPNYSFEKRRKELERKSKKEKKKQQKLLERGTGASDEPASESTSAPAGE